VLPTLFHLKTPFGAVAVPAFGVSLALSVLAGWYLVRRDERFRAEPLARLYLLAVVVAFFGARLAYLLGTPRAVRSGFDVIAIFDGGLSAFGAVVAALALLPLVARAERAERISLTAPAFADALAVPGLVAGAIVALGAYLAGASFGRLLPAAAPGFLRALGTFPRSAVHEDAVGRFPEGPPVLVHQLHAYAERLDVDAAASLPVHPVQLYEAALLAVAALAAHLYAREPRRAGHVAALGLASYALVRLATDPFRGDPERMRIGAISAPALASGVLLVVLAALGMQRAYRARASAPAA
jgi:phosphatidylglycerol:prolipoprotein diacylglycerol transferase